MAKHANISIAELLDWRCPQGTDDAAFRLAYILARTGKKLMPYSSEHPTFFSDMIFAINMICDLPLSEMDIEREQIKKKICQAWKLCRAFDRCEDVMEKLIEDIIFILCKIGESGKPY